MDIKVNKKHIDILKFVDKHPQIKEEEINWVFFGGIAVDLNKLKENNKELREHKDMDLIVLNDKFLDKSLLFYLDESYHLQLVNNQRELYSQENTKVELYNKEAPNFEELKKEDVEVFEFENYKIHFACKEFLLLGYILLYSSIEERELKSIKDMIESFKFDLEKLKKIVKRTKFSKYITNNFYKSIMTNNFIELQKEYRKILLKIKDDFNVDSIKDENCIYLLSLDKEKIKKSEPQNIYEMFLFYYSNNDLSLNNKFVVSQIEKKLHTEKKIKDFLRNLCIIGDLIDKKFENKEKRVNVKIKVLNESISSEILFRYTFSNLKRELEKFK